MDYKTQLKEWLSSLRWGKERLLWQENDNGERVRVRLWTREQSYLISATPTYLGCIASTRAPAPGEDWTRGNDLADGPFSAQTWHSILAEIVGYELLPLSTRADGIPVAVPQV